MTSQTLKMKAVCLFRTNCPTKQCPFQKTRILTTMPLRKSQNCQPFTQWSSKAFEVNLDNFINSTTWAGQGKNHLNSVNNDDSKSKQNNDN